MINKGTGVKLDNEKPKLGNMLDCLRDVLPEICKIYQFGVDKYGEGNWKKVEDGENRFRNALIRHYLSGKEFDDETGFLESTHIAYNALMVLWFELKRRENEGQATQQPR